jgi:hypothetical protein
MSNIIKQEYDANNNQIYYENSDGYWVKREYNDNGKLIYCEYSYGKQIYYII